MQIAEFDDSGRLLGYAEVEPVRKKDEEWRNELAPGVCFVTRQKGTEPPFTGAYWDNHADGIYRCACCGTALFDSRAKYESGTGWPSFFEPLDPVNLRTERDCSHGMVRVEALCALCDAHLGHVFPDGPPPAGMRYCMNSAALRFVPRAPAAMTVWRAAPGSDIVCGGGTPDEPPLVSRLRKRRSGRACSP